MDKKKLLNLIKRNEGEKLDFKERIDFLTEGTKKEIVKDICAIANSRGGRGYIIIGVRDKTKEIIGVGNVNYITEERIQQIVTSRCEPPIPISLEEVMVDDKKVFVITIYNGHQKPYQVRENGAFYIRRGSTTDIMRKQELISAFQEGLNFNVEVCPIIGSDIKVIDIELVKRYFKYKGVDLTGENKEFLLNISNIIYKDNITGDEMCTLGALLVFSRLNSIYVPHNMIKIINKIDDEEYKVITVQGTLIDMIDSTQYNLNNILPAEYPVNAVVEAVKNAVLYRDYAKVNKVIEVIISKKNIIVTSPGLFIKRSKNSFMSYARRNMWIYEKLIILDDKNRFSKSGRGFTVMKKAFKDIGKVKIIEYKEEEAVRVVFPGIESLNTKIKIEGVD